MVDFRREIVLGEVGRVVWEGSSNLGGCCLFRGLVRVGWVLCRGFGLERFLYLFYLYFRRGFGCR